MAYLEIDGERIPLGDSNRLGRGDDVDVHIDDRSCSRVHALIERRSQGWAVKDLASANGTTVNGASVTQKRLEDGDQIAIGDVAMVFHRGAPAADLLSERGRARASSSRKTAMLLGGALLLVGVFVWQAFSGDGGESKEPSNTLVAEGNPAEGETDEGSSPDQDSTETAAKAAFASRFEALRAEDSIRGLDDLRFDYEELEREAPADLAASVAEHFRSLEAKRLREGETLLKTSVARARNAGEAGRWGEATSGLDEALLSLRVQGLGDLAREGLRARILMIGDGKRDWDGRVEQSRARVDAGASQEARRILEGALVDFRGLNFEALARTELRLLELRARSASELAARASEESSTGTGSRPTADARETKGLDAAAKADRAAAERRWTEAALGYRELANSGGNGDLAQRSLERARLMEAYRDLKAAVIAAAGSEDGLKGLKVGKITARPESVDDDRLVLRVGRRGEVIWTWREISPDRLLALFERVTREPEAKLSFARVAFDLDQEERAEAMLVRAVKRKELRPLADEIVAAARGEAVPGEGYHIHEGRFLGPKAWAQARDRIQAERLARELPRARGRRYEDLLAELEAIGEPGRAAFRAGLAKRLNARAEQARGLACFAKPAKARRRLASLLEERRKVAFALIFDTARYPYPYGPNQAEVQAEVDGLTGKVREVWDQPEVAILETEDSWRELRTEMAALETRLKSLGGDATVVARLDDELRTTLNPAEHAWSDQQRKKIAEVETFNAEIKSSIATEERSCHEHTNAYRKMMGLLPVKIDEALVLAARSHSQEMKDLGYFSHTSPIPDRSSPSKRARLSGWGGGVSENIARGQGSGAAAVRGWISSSGHHRNLLGKRHTHLGCGKAKDGLFWTQNFGTGASSSISREKIDPESKKTDEDQKER